MTRDTPVSPSASGPSTSAQADRRRDPRIDSLISYWRSCRHGHPIPLRRDFDILVNRPRLLPVLVILERLPDGRFVHRYVGSTIVSLAGRDATGRIVDADLYGDRWQTVANAYARALDDGVMLWGIDRATWPRGEWRSTEWLIAPLAGSDGAARWVATLTMILDGPATAHVPEIHVVPNEPDLP